MGHQSVNPSREYRLLQQRLDRNVTGAPPAPAFLRILELLFTPAEADVARRLPTRPTRVRVLAERLGIPEDEMSGILEEMARKGLVFDLQKGEKRYAALAPVVIGFFEFTFMRTGPDGLDRKELAELFEEYFFEGDGAFARSVFGGTVQMGRSLVRESALKGRDLTEVLDFERATRVVETASRHAVSTCACRHHASHLGTACDRPQRACLSLNAGAGPLVRSGHAEGISKGEALTILREAQEAGLAQTADNVKNGVGFVCNCCGCCCGMMRSLRTFGLRSVVTSNWIAEVDEAACSGCGLCENACPAGAIALREQATSAGPRKKAWRDEALCLGCGVCTGACRKGAMTMKARARRVFTPEDTFERVVAMAVERGKLADLLLEDPGDLPSRALGRVVKVIESLPPWKAALAVAPVRSVFLGALLAGMRPFAKGTPDLLS